MDEFDEMSHLISLHAQQQARGYVPFAVGHVVAYDPSTNAVQVALPGFPVVDPTTGATTGAFAVSPWVQLSSPWVGPGWGFQTAPSVGSAQEPFSGTQCAVFISYQGVISLAGHLLYNQNALPPDSTLVAGEAILKHETGTYIKFQSAGNLAIFANQAVNVTNAAGITVAIEASGSIAITLPSGQTFSINGTADALALVSKLVSAFNSHTHLDDGTGTPTSPWTAATVESAIVQVGS